ncbi:hypothetical protein V2I01_27060 [Micromonospora sp. BRA006-A]|nr:hypothetical protein [Micromonospora sp. BRA006-A]
MLLGAGLIICAAIVLALKIAVIVQLAILAFEVAQAIATAVVTFGASLAEIPIFQIITREIVGAPHRPGHRETARCLARGAAGAPPRNRPPARSSARRSRSWRSRSSGSPTESEPPTKVVRVERRDFHATAQFRRKMAALKKLSDSGKLYKATNPVQRDKSITDGYKDRIRQKIWDKYWPHDKDLANRLSQRLSDYHPDHVWELQLGGPDTVDNLKLLHGRTNTDIGSQIWGQIQNLPDGTPIRIEVVIDFRSRAASRRTPRRPGRGRAGESRVRADRRARRRR